MCVGVLVRVSRVSREIMLLRAGMRAFNSQLIISCVWCGIAYGSSGLSIAMLSGQVMGKPKSKRHEMCVLRVAGILVCVSLQFYEAVIRQSPCNCLP